MQSIWQCALKVLKVREEAGSLTELKLKDHVRRTALSSADRRRLANWLQDVIRWQHALDAIVAWRTNEREQAYPVRMLLRLGLAQLFYTHEYPSALIASAAREAAYEAGFQSGVANLVFILLSNCVHSICVIEGWLKNLQCQYPETAYSHPFWLVERWTRQFGGETTRQMLDWSNSRPFRYARLNSVKTTAVALQEQWLAEGVKFESSRRDWVGADIIFRILHAPPLESLASWRQGWFVIQDPSTLLPGCLLEPQAGEYVLDSCIGDGLSTAWLAQLGGGQIQLHSEIGSGDSQSAQPVVTRLGLKGLKLRREPFAFPEKGGVIFQYNKVLVQAPSSGTGLLRWDIERRWTLSPLEIETSAAREFEWLRAVAPRVKRGGVIVYATTSAEPEENQQVVARFLEGHSHFRLDHERQLLPSQQAVDGVYAARLVRVEDARSKPARGLVVAPELPTLPSPPTIEIAPPTEPVPPVVPLASVTRQFRYEMAGSLFTLTLGEKPTRKPGPNEVLVRIRAVALGRRDWLLLQETQPIPKDRTGMVAGTEGAGEIVAVGAGSTWRVGERVMACPYPHWIDSIPNHDRHREALGMTCDGILTEYAVLPDTALARLPDALSFEEGACVPFAGLSAWNALVTRGQIQPGEKVLITGLGGIGVWAMQIALAAEAKVFVLSRSETKRQRAIELGAARAYGPDNPKLSSLFKSCTHNRGVQHVVLSGGPETVIVAIAALSRCGQVCCFGGFSGGLTPINFNTVAVRQARLDGISSGSRAQLEACLLWLVEKGVRPVVDLVFDFEEANEALRCLTDTSPFGKVVVRMRHPE